MQRMKGFGLVEVMVALLVIAVGVMGLMSLQTYTLREAKEAEYYNRANFMAKDMFERMRGNFAGVSSYQVTQGSAVDTPGKNCEALAAGASCSATEMVNWDLYKWCESLETAFRFSTIDPDQTFNCSALPASIRLTTRTSTTSSINFTRVFAEVAILVPLDTQTEGGTVQTLTFSFASEI